MEKRPSDHKPRPVSEWSAKRKLAYIVRGSDEAFQEPGSREELLRFLAGVHSKLGASRGFTRANIFVNASTNGTFIKVTYQSTFEQGTAVEVFTWRKASGDLKLVGYHVESKVFLPQ